MEQRGMFTKNKMLDKLFLSVAKSLHGEPPFFIWPAPYSTPAECEFYLADYFLHDFYTDIIELKRRGYKIESIAKMLKNPSRIAQTIWPFGHVVNVDENFKRELTELATIIIELLSAYRKDPFNQDGKNIIWSQDKVLDFLEDKKIIDARDSLFKEYKDIVSKLEGVLWLYSELLYFSIHEVCKEFHGPYMLKDGRVVLIREYYDLKPGFWPFTSTFPHENILICEIYKPDTKIMFDFFGRLRVEKPLIHNLVAFFVITNNKSTITYDNLKGLYNSVVEVSTKGAKYVQNLSRIEIMKKFVQSYYYILKPLRDSLKKNWQPPKEIFDDIKNESKRSVVEQTYARFKEMAKIPPDMAIDILSKVFDPRVK